MSHEVAVKNERGEVKFSLDESGWLHKYSNYLENGRITLLNGAALSVDTSGHKWVLFYRNMGTTGPGATGNMVRVLCVGWQDTIGGRNVKALNWIYPNGFVESAEEPTFWRHFL